MARGDLLIHLVRAARERDDPELRRTVESMIAEERNKQHHLLAERLEDALRADMPLVVHDFPVEPQQGFSIKTPAVKLDSLFLSERNRQAIEELIEEHQRAEVLKAYALEPRHRVLLTGPPGNGKTSLAEAIAEALLLPLVVLRYEEVVGSYLGETASRLAGVFEYSRSRRCVLFFDEFDALGKERGDEHETGEIKRVVTSLLLGVDALPSHTLLVAASNHPELLDRAAHRRFELRLDLPVPARAQRIDWFEHFAEQNGEPLGVTAETFARKSAGASYSQLQDLANDVKRQGVLRPGVPIQRMFPERLSRWREVSALETNG